jgi:hypothetical protein
LKDDINDLKSQVNDLKNQNDTLKTYNSTLQQQLKGVINSLGSDEPITATTTFTDNAGTTRTVTGVYKFKSADYSTQKAVNNGDGTYSIYVERFSDVSWYEGAWAQFTYNPTTKAVTSITGGQYWNDEDPYNDYAYYTSSYGGTGLTLAITVDKFDTTTGDFSMKFAATGTAAYTSAISSGYSPNQGKPDATNFTFTGKLRIFSIN